jgi:hypothetical protein
MKKFRDFESAREFVRSLGLKSNMEWQEYCKSGNKPDDIPSSPTNNYKKDFKGMGDYLGTGTVAPQNKVFLPFKEAREFVILLNLKSLKEWKEYCTSGNKPVDIPTRPYTTYKQDFKGLGDWLGTGNIANQDKQYLPFKEAREFARALKLKGTKEWNDYCKSGNKPDDIPTGPDGTYKNKGWKGMGDYLGTGTVATFDKIFRPFKEAREFVILLNLKSLKEWNDYCKSGNKPDDISFNPQRTYKNEFKGFGDWLGTGTVATKDRQYRSFTEARAFVRSLNLKGQVEWNDYCKSGNKPDDIPAGPDGTYKNKGWKGMGDWLGNEKVFRPYKEARVFVRKLGLKTAREWREYCASGNKPDDIPSTPWDVYKEWKKK